VIELEWPALRAARARSLLDSIDNAIASRTWSDVTDMRSVVQDIGRPADL